MEHAFEDLTGLETSSRRIASFLRRLHANAFVLGCAASILAAPGAAAQLPTAQLPQIAPRWEPPGFDFSLDGVWRPRARGVSQRRAALLAGGHIAELNAPVQAGAPAPFAQAVSGVLQVPVILFNYQDTRASELRDPAVYGQVLFSTTPPFGRPYTYRSFYEQLSNGLFSVQGAVYGYAALSRNEVVYSGGTSAACQVNNPYHTSDCNGIWSGEAIDSMQVGLREALALVDGAVDFGPYDGDRNGVVDLAVFLQPARDGACGGSNHLWSHRFVLQQPYVTNDPAPGGGFEVVRDYILQSGVGGQTACDSTQYMPIGTIAHETGHGLGLPDLYDVTYATSGIGEWGLMGSGNYTTPYSPSRMEAWTLNQLGWVTLVPLTVSGTFSLGAAPLSDTAFVVSVQGANPRGEYFLIENRQAAQSDSALIRVHGGGGLMVWHIDGISVGNYGRIHEVALEEADGLRQLWCETNGCNRGDGGDPYPGWSGNTVFSSLTTPAAIKNFDATFVGFAIDSIQQLVPNGLMSFRLRFEPLIALNPGTVRFNAAQSGSDPARQTVDVTNGGAGVLDSLELGIVGPPGQPFGWLTATLSSHTAPATITLTAKSTGLAIGTYTNTVEVSSRVANNSPQVDTVTLTVMAGPLIGLAPESLTIRVLQGVDPPRQHLQIANIGGDTLRWRAAHAQSWLSLPSVSGMLPGGWSQSLSVEVNSAGLLAGDYRDSITVSDPRAGNSPQTVAVRLTVTQRALIRLVPDSLVSTVLQGTSPSPQTFQVTNAGGDTLKWRAASDQAWIHLRPDSGTLSVGQVQSVTLEVTSSNLTPGTYRATVTVTGLNASNSPQSVAIRLTVNTLALSCVMDQLLVGNSCLGQVQLQYLDLIGNDNGRFDVGDFRAWLILTGRPSSALGLVDQRKRHRNPSSGRPRRITP